MTDHEAAINALIEPSIQEANRKQSERHARREPQVELRDGADGKPFRYQLWNRDFHRAMNRRARQAGLRR